MRPHSRIGFSFMTRSGRPYASTQSEMFTTEIGGAEMRAAEVMRLMIEERKRHEEEIAAERRRRDEELAEERRRRDKEIAEERQARAREADDE